MYFYPIHVPPVDPGDPRFFYSLWFSSFLSSRFFFFSFSSRILLTPSYAAKLSIVSSASNIQPNTMNTNDVFSSIHDVDLDVPPDLDLDNVSLVSKMPSATTSTDTPAFPWSSNLDMLAAAGQFTSLQTAANQLLADNAGSIQSLGSYIKPYLHGPIAPILLIVGVAILASLLISFIISILQMVALAAAVIYFFPSIMAAIQSSMASSSGKASSRTPVAAFAGMLAASYAFSSLAAVVVLVSGAYTMLNQNSAAPAEKKSPTKSKSRAPRQDEQEEKRRRRRSSSSSMFQKVSRRRGSFDY